MFGICVYVWGELVLSELVSMFDVVIIVLVSDGVGYLFVWVGWENVV